MITEFTTRYLPLGVVQHNEKTRSMNARHLLFFSYWLIVGSAVSGQSSQVREIQFAAAKPQSVVERLSQMMSTSSVNDLLQITGNLRDAALARAALDALRDLGGPVVVITGNGHARTDWGAPALLAGQGVFALGQSEGGRPPEGTFDLVLDAAPVDRPDPCLAFR